MTSLKMAAKETNGHLSISFSHMLLHTVGYSAGPRSVKSMVSSSPWLTTSGT